MHDLNMPHLDDFTLLRYVADDLDELERQRASQHLKDCSTCQATWHEIVELDRELADAAKDSDSRRDFEVQSLSPDDPFYRRPRSSESRHRHSGEPADFAVRSVAASEEGAALSEVILDAAKASAAELEDILGRIDLSDLAHRYALLYALQEAGRQIAENPKGFLSLAETSILLAREITAASQPAEAAAVPVPILLGQAQQLAGQACLWTGELEAAGTRFQIAYRAFGLVDEETGLAVTELLESQRRSFTDHGSEGLALIRRAAVTFESFGLEDYVARARVVEGLALSCLGRYDEAVEQYRRALPVFEELSLWSNYVGAVNSLGTALNKLGRIDEARREYARALRRLSREHHRSWVGFIRMSLAEVLMSAGRFREAAASSAQAARAFADCGLPLHRLKAALFEIESWARGNDPSRARHRFQIFIQEVDRLGGLDPEITRQIEEALSGSQPNYQRVSELRREASEFLESRLDAQRA